MRIGARALAAGHRRPVAPPPPPAVMMRLLCGPEREVVDAERELLAQMEHPAIVLALETTGDDDMDAMLED